MNPSLRRSLFRATALMVAALISLVGLVGFAHTPQGKPLMSWLAKQAGCPADLNGGAPKEVEQFRQAQLRKHSGSAIAKAHPALGFELGQSTRTDVEAWATNASANCHSTRSNSVLSCTLSVKGDLPIDDLHLQFDETQRLVAVDLFRSQACGRDALEHLKREATRLDQEVGQPARVSGKLDATYLQKPFRQAALEYRFQGYRARLSATNLGKRGIRVREQYQWAPTPS